MDPDKVYSNRSDAPVMITGVKNHSHDETKTENIYQTLKPARIRAASPAQRDSLWKRTSLLFISLWIITLISLITTLGLYFKQTSALQNELKEQQRDSSTLITELQKQLENMRASYLPTEMCSSFSPKMTGRDGVVIKP
ncbi:hypothetical protein JZ751_011515, partial [Albula glossodonta]